MQFDWLPMFRNRVPRIVRPWVYVLLAFLFQMSGGMYMGAVGDIVSGRQFLREDVLMCLYCNLAGMSVYFPLLFRLKFHFPNKVLMLGAAGGLAVCTFLVPLAPNLPCLWALCVITGFCKIQGTFECLSSIQLWITPKRDFRVFFSVLHIFILGAMQITDYLAAYVAYVWRWEYMHLIMCAVYLTVVVALLILTKRIRLIPDVPMKDIDWLGGILWLAWLLQSAALFCYGHTLDWFHSESMRALLVTTVLTLVAAVAHSFLAVHPFISPEIFKGKRVVAAFVVVALAEFLLATENVLEEVFYEVGMDYSNMQTAATDVWSFIGVVGGSLFALLWMKVLNFSPLRLTTVSFWLIAAYVILFYNIIASDFDYRSLRLLIVLRTSGYAMVGASLMVILNKLTSFQTFFMTLSVFNMFHMIIGGTIGAALYSYGLDYFLADNFSRYAEYFDHVAIGQCRVPFESLVGAASRSFMLVSTKQILGWVAYAAIFCGFALLLYKVPFVSKGYKHMMSWTELAFRTVKRLRREDAQAETGDAQSDGQPVAQTAESPAPAH